MSERNVANCRIKSQPTVASKFSQLSHQNSANCRIKIQPTVASKFGQLAHLVYKYLWNLKYFL